VPRVRARGQRLGRETREVVLHLAFAGLGAEEGRSAAFEDRAAPIATPRAVGYEENGEARGHRRDDIEIVGLEGCPDLSIGSDQAC